MNIYSLFHKGQLSALCNYSSSLWGSVVPFFLPHLEHSSQMFFYRETLHSEQPHGLISLPGLS